MGYCRIQEVRKVDDEQNALRIGCFTVAGLIC